MMIELRTRSDIDEFCDTLWLEDGLSKNTLEAYRRDLRALYEKLRPWFESAAVPSAAANFFTQDRSQKL